MKKLIKGFVKTDPLVWMWLAIATIMIILLLSSCVPEVIKVEPIQEHPFQVEYVLNGRTHTLNLRASKICWDDRFTDVGVVSIASLPMHVFTFSVTEIKDVGWIKSAELYKRLINWLDVNGIKKVEIKSAVPSILERLKANEQVDG